MIRDKTPALQFRATTWARSLPSGNILIPNSGLVIAGNSNGDSCTAPRTWLTCYSGDCRTTNTPKEDSLGF